MSAEVRRLHSILDRASLVHDVINRWHGHPQVAALKQMSMTAWRCMRSVAGILNGHPNVYLRAKPLGRWRLGIQMPAFLISWTHFSDRSREQWLQSQLQVLSRAVADARSSTLSLEISSLLGRNQIELHHVLASLGHSLTPKIRSVEPLAPRSTLASSPYLAA